MPEFEPAPPGPAFEPGPEPALDPDPAPELPAFWFEPDPAFELSFEAVVVPAPPAEVGGELGAGFGLGVELGFEPALGAAPVDGGTAVFASVELSPVESPFAFFLRTGPPTSTSGEMSELARAVLTSSPFDSSAFFGKSLSSSGLGEVLSSATGDVASV